MRKSSSWLWQVCGCAAACALLAVPALATGDVVTRGADMWITAGGGSTYSSFGAEPIPADFFCPGSKPFTGSVAMRGEPLATEPAGALQNIDTIVERLDDAVFNDKGEATTRLKLLALSLTSVEPVVTECGPYRMDIRLTGEQSTTTMKIIKTSAEGGLFEAPLSIRAKVTFTPIGREGEVRELLREVNLGSGTSEVWSWAADARYVDYVKVDVDGNGKADTFVPTNSNFEAGRGVMPAALDAVAVPCLRPGQWVPTSGAPPCCPPGYQVYTSCHCDPSSINPYEPNGTCGHLHCVYTCVKSPIVIGPAEPFEPATPSYQ